ncbi:hypothetical protein Tco_0071200, partial [Tanacetum coccineum]
MLIPDAFLIDKIRATYDFKEYATVFVRVDVPMNQPQPVVSTQGTHRTTPSAHMSPTLTASPQKKKKRKQISKETSSQRKSLKVTIKQKQAKNTPIPPPSDNKERDEIAEASLISLALHKTAIYASEFVDSMLNDDKDDFRTRIEPGSHKEHPKKIDDDDDDETAKEKKDNEKKDDVEDKDNDDHIHTLVKTQEMGSMNTRKEKMQIPIPSPIRSPRNNLSLHKTLSHELMETIS